MGRVWIVIVTFVWAFGASASWAADTSSWSAYLHDPARDNAVLDGHTFQGPVVQVHEAWSFLTEGGIAASPVLANGLAYVPSWDGNIYAINLTTHGVAWKKFLGTATTWEGNTGVSNPPAFVPDVGPNGAVVVGGGGREVASDSHLYL